MTDHANSIYSSHDVGMLGKQAAEQAAAHKQFGIELDIPGTFEPAVKDYFAPLLPWEICAVQAQTSNGKTLFTNWWMRKIAQQLSRQGRDEVIIHVSLEESVEAIAFAEYGRLLGQPAATFARGEYTNAERMNWAMTMIDRTPVWTIADSPTRPADAPELTLSNIYRATRDLISGKVTGEPFKPAVMIVDYLQALPIDPEVREAQQENQRRLQVAKDVFRLREMTTHLSCPIIVPLQAKQELKGNNPPLMIPGTYDGMETSAIATRFDRVLSLWMTKMTYPVGYSFNYGDRLIKVTDNQVFFKVNKQRGGLPSGLVWELAIDYATQEYADAYGKPTPDLRQAYGA